MRQQASVRALRGAHAPRIGLTWLNSLPPESVICWLDFEEVFNRNFTGTYLRPGNAQLLAVCKLKEDKSDRAYLTRWTSLRNSCEGILEFQAVQYFVQGCRDQTLLKHKLLRKSPKTMAHLMAIADEYATADAGMTNPIRLDEAGRVITDGSATRRSRTETQEGGRSTRRDSDASGKRKSTNDRVESKVIAITEGRPADGFDNRCLGTSNDMRWTRARNNYESLLDRL